MRQNYVESVVNLLNKQEQVRNISVIAHVDHGKTTLVDSLLAKAGIISQDNAGKLCLMDTKAEEQKRGITIKSTGISLLFSHEDGSNYVVNLVDSPGHVDFSSEVTAALRITDGALVVVDCVEGVCVQTETVLRQAIEERIKPVLHINKVDRGIMELSLEPEELYQKLESVIQNVNSVLSIYQETVLGELQVDPRIGSVSFGSGKQGWAFTLPQFAQILAKKFSKDPKSILKRLWGDNFYDPETRKFINVPISPSGKKLDRFVCSTILKPIITLFKNVANNDMDSLNELLPKIGVKLSNEEKDFRGQELITKILQNWIPAGDALSKMIIDHLPSPKVAQKYRVETLYTGPLDDECATAIRNCDPNGPVMMFVSKMVPSTDGKRFYAYGRLFSGTLKAQTEVKIMGANYVFGENHDVSLKKIPRVVLMMGKFIENVVEVPCGNTVAIVGIDNYLIKSGTLSTHPDAHVITPMKFSVSPVVRSAVSPKNAAQLPKFISGLKRLEKTDPCLQVTISETGESIVAGAGQLHIEVSLNDLRELLGEDVPFNISPPIVEFAETILAKSSITCFGKSPNKHNHLYFTAEPLTEELVSALESSKINLSNKKEMQRQLVHEFGWDANDARKLWFIKGTNCVVDTTSAAQYLQEIKDHISVAFEQVVGQAGLCGEPMRGIRFNIVDVKVHSDAPHRSSAQITPTARRLFLAAQLSASPCMVEPVFLAEIQTVQEMISKVYNVLTQRRGFVIDEIPKLGSPMYTVKAYLPVQESIGFDEALRSATSGRAFPQLMFSHWQLVKEDPYKKETLGNKLVCEVRERKGMKEALPTLEDYNDKL